MLATRQLFLICFSVLFTLALTIPPVQAQDVSYSISGKVTDAETGQPLEGVNVFLDGTTSGAATDSTGRYHFQTGHTGQKVLVASFVGYNRKRISVVLNRSSPKQFDFELEPHNLVLDEIVVNSSNREWRRNLEYFKEVFLGTGSFAEEVVIENPFVLDFNTEGNFEATALEALKLRNEALGYHLTMELVSFEFGPGFNTGIYKVFAYFKPMDAPNENTKRKWQQNRREAYEGSMKHYLKSLYHDQLRENDFYQDPSGGIKLADKSEAYSHLSLKGLLPLSDNYKVFRFSARKVAAGHNIKLYGMSDQVRNAYQLSYLYPRNREPYFLIDSRGHLFDAGSIRVAGKWSRDRVAKLLPLDYSLEK